MRRRLLEAESARGRRRRGRENAGRSAIQNENPTHLEGGEKYDFSGLFLALLGPILGAHLASPGLFEPGNRSLTPVGFIWNRYRPKRMEFDPFPVHFLFFGRSGKVPGRHPKRP